MILEGGRLCRSRQDRRTGRGQQNGDNAGSEADPGSFYGWIPSMMRPSSSSNGKSIPILAARYLGNSRLIRNLSFGPRMLSRWYSRAQRHVKKSRNFLPFGGIGLDFPIYMFY